MDITRRIKHLTFIVVFLLPMTSAVAESQCYGTTANGYLSDGVKLPKDGRNFETYSSLARIAGRTYVHSLVNEIIVSAYQQLETEQPNKVFKYAETGLKEGGPFKPHKTHQNGLSVDFMVPVVNSKGQSVHLPTNPFNKLGYDIEFNDNSEYQGLKIDYDAMAAHVVLLHKEAKKRGHDLWRVIFAPELQYHLFNTNYADYLKEYIQFSKKRSWVRHDEHYHVDFEIPCSS